MGAIPCQMGPLFSMGMSDDGLFICMRFQSWMGFQPLFIPWDDIEILPSRITIFPTVAVSFKKEPFIKLYLPTLATNIFEPYLNGFVA